jgi:AraC-like DNA-binding protein
LLMEFASRSGAKLHARVHHLAGRDQCKFRESDLLVQLLGDGSDDPCHVFRRWARSFFSELQRYHPESAARQAARLLQRDFRRPPNITALARQVHTTPLQLRRGFRSEFEMPLRQYIAGVRLVAGLERLVGEKTEATALEIGYKSKKNFYRLFKQLTGLKPSEFRHLSEEQRRQLTDAARARLKWRARPVNEH